MFEINFEDAELIEKCRKRHDSIVEIKRKKKEAALLGFAPPENKKDEEKKIVFPKTDCKVYADGRYDFTFAGRFIIYHIKAGSEIHYIALDKTTLRGSLVKRAKKEIAKEQYASMTHDITYAIRYIGVNVGAKDAPTADER